jgi:micrococcal nuclease
MTKRGIVRAAVLALALVIAPIARADFTGRVVAVLDGDTIEVLVNRRAVRVRLAQIDAPEKGQPYGSRAKQALARLSFRQAVTVSEAGRDRYGRVLGTVHVAGANVNAAMVRQGMAWVYRRYATDRSLYQAEEAARAARRGLWADPSPAPPWDYRRQRARE